MIRTINGSVQAVTDQDISINIGALSLVLSVPNAHQFQLGTTIELQTYLHWNSDQGPSLFGFITDLERSVFLLIISCSGIGPKLALALLSQLGAEQFIHALQTNNEKALSSVSGIGSKKAEQIVTLLRHKVGALAKVSGATKGSAVMQWDDVAQALASLNYTRTEISTTMRHLGETYSGTSLPFDQLIRHALSFLTKKP